MAVALKDFLIHRTLPITLSLILLATDFLPLFTLAAQAADPTPPPGAARRTPRRHVRAPVPPGEYLASTNRSVRPHAGRINLRSLDLTRTPSEEELIQAGELGSPLTPSRSADSRRIGNTAQRRRQEADNHHFGRAMHAWNRHDYGTAVRLFKEHRNSFTNSPWAGEAELHMGCDAQFSGKWPEAKDHFEWILANHEKGSAIYQKAKLRRAVLHMDQGEIESAMNAFTQMLETETDWERRTYAHYWIRQLNLFKAKQTALRACGKDSVAYLCQLNGQSDVADKVKTAEAPGEHGFSVGELSDFAREHGLTPTAVRAQTTQLTRLPTPFIGHYADQHFVVVKNIHPSEGVRVFDPRLQRETQLTSEEFTQQWSGLALVFANPPADVALASELDLKTEVGGCCGIPRYPDDLGDDDEDTGDDNQCRGMPVWRVNKVNMNVVVQDIPLWYDNPLGYAIEIKLTYNSQDSLNQLRPFGNKWLFNYASYAMESPGGAPLGSVLVVMPEGQGHSYQPNGDGGYNAPAGVFNTLRKTGSFAFDLEFPNGMIYHYGVPAGMAGSSSLLLSIEDRNGNRVTINHDANGNITSIMDSQGRFTRFFYNGQGKISRIDDPFGRSATFTYDGAGNLTGQTDMGGVAYGYSYDANVYLTSIIKPAGTTRFRIEPASGIPNGSDGYPIEGGAMWQNYRITVTDPLGKKEEYHYNGFNRSGWRRDRNQFKEGVAPSSGGATSFGYTLVGGRGKISSSTKANGAVMTRGSFTASRKPQTVIDENGGRNLYTYNSMGQVLTHTDPRGNTARFTYAPNGNDVTSITDREGNVISRLAYDSRRNVISVTDALDRTMRFAFSSRGQLLHTTNALGQVRSFDYDGIGNLLRVRQGTNVLRSYTRDAVGRAATETDPDGYVLAYTYDDLNRVIAVTYPDGTFTERQYGCCVLESQMDQLGRVTSFTHDSLNRMQSRTDPAGRTIRYRYDPNGNLITLYDAMGRPTRWEYNNVNRMTDKIYVDGSRETFSYDGIGNLKSKTDARANTLNYRYDANNNLTNKTGTGLAPVSFAYDVNNRRTLMIDGIGTTTYAYNRAGELIAEDGPWSNDLIQYSFDGLGRQTNRAIGGVSATTAYDELGRVGSATSVLGSFTYGYLSPASQRLTTVSYPNGQTSTYDYFDNLGNRRLQRITHRKPDTSLLSRFTHAYNPHGNITNWLQELGAYTEAWAADYDGADQLTSVVTTTSAGITNTVYAYDKAGNRLVEQVAANRREFNYNALNELTASSEGPASAVNYEWDAEKRLTAIDSGNGRIDFSYDGIGRRCRIVEKLNNVSQSERRFVWCRMEICEERDLANVTTHRFFGQGEQRGQKNYYYTRDHINSIRELTDGDAVLHARYRYTSFGISIRSEGNQDSTFGFTGHFTHRGSALVMAQFRAYDPANGRWLNRDPVHELAGVNLYTYVFNNPLLYKDSLGLDVDVALVPSDSKHREVLQNVANRPGVIEIGAHGSPEFIFDPNGKSVSVPQLIKLLKKMGYKNRTPIKLYSCSTGKKLPYDLSDPFAQRLANAWDGPVEAATDNYWRGRNGEEYIAPPLSTNPSEPDLTRPGKWITYGPETDALVEF